tara:strand:- start:136 stop:729 length:594 start_codon:yes stop_codon:yes gene_type:complete
MKKLLFLLVFIPLVSYGQTAQEYTYNAIIKSQNQNYQSALSDLSKAIELKPNYALAYYNRGLVKTRLNDFNGAIDDYSKAIEINPKDEEYFSNRGLVKLYLKDFQGAKKDFIKSAEIKPNVGAYINLGGIYNQLNLYDEAIKNADKALKLDSTTGKAYGLRAISKYYLNDYEGSCRDAYKAKFYGEKMEELIKIVCN